ncbi:MAG: hypothetical protein Q9160_001145 [Pyrenula sp. 1 TL-2023]
MGSSSYTETYELTQLPQLPQLRPLSRFPSVSKMQGSGKGAQGLFIRVDAPPASATTPRGMERESGGDGVGVGAGVVRAGEGTVPSRSQDEEPMRSAMANDGAVGGERSRVAEASGSSSKAAIDINVRGPSRPIYQASHDTASVFSFVPHADGPAPPAPTAPLAAIVDVDTDADVNIQTPSPAHIKSRKDTLSLSLFDVDAEYVRTNTRSIEAPPHGLKRLREIIRGKDRWVVMGGIAGKGLRETKGYVTECVMDTVPGCLRRKLGSW